MRERQFERQEWGTEKLEMYLRHGTDAIAKAVDDEFQPYVLQCKSQKSWPIGNSLFGLLTNSWVVSHKSM